MIRLPAGTVCSVEEYAKKAGLTKGWVYRSIRANKLKAYKISRVWLIPSEALIVNRRTKTGKYIGVTSLINGDIEGALKKRGIDLK